MNEFLNKDLFDNKSILVTGGTGSFGKTFINTVLKKYNPARLIVFSRDELKQFEMQSMFKTDSPIRFFIGDVRDKDRLYRAFEGLDIVVHAAALKQVPALEYNPLEAIKTNIIGAANIVDAAIDCNVKKVIALSTDKACNPINLYGATKLCSDKLFTASRTYSGAHKTKFSVVRYGNVVGSRGSVIPHFIKLKDTGRIPITHTDMTRFVITLDQGVNFVLKCLNLMNGGEIFIPKIPSMKITDLAASIAPEAEYDLVGIRPGEKLHETLISFDDAHRTLEFENHFIIKPYSIYQGIQMHFPDFNKVYKNGKPCEEGFEYRSDNNPVYLNINEIQNIISGLQL